MGLHILRDLKLATSIWQAKFFCVMADKVTDASNKEQVVVCSWSVDQPHKDFTGLHAAESIIRADTLVEVIKDTMLRLELCISDCCGQCYDGAANMSGAKKGTASQICSEEPRAIFIHCYGHALNLAVGNTVKRNHIRTTRYPWHNIWYFQTSEVLSTTWCIFDKLKGEISLELTWFRILCPTRWIVRASSLEIMINNYAVFQASWEDAKDIRRTQKHVLETYVGVQATMTTFAYFGLVLGERILKHTDNLSKTFQNPSLLHLKGKKLLGSPVRHCRNLNWWIIWSILAEYHALRGAERG